MSLDSSLSTFISLDWNNIPILNREKFKFAIFLKKMDKTFSSYSLLSMFHTAVFKNLQLPLNSFLAVKWYILYERILKCYFSYFYGSKIRSWPYNGYVYDSTVNIIEEDIHHFNFESVWWKPWFRTTLQEFLCNEVVAE